MRRLRASWIWSTQDRPARFSSMIQSAPVKPISRTADWISQKWGCVAQTLPLQSVAVLTTPTSTLKSSPRRLLYEIFNVGNSNVSLGFDPTIAVGTGILIPPLGGSIVISAEEDMDLVIYPVYTISAAAGNTLWIVETQIA
jgi:hypothetical protein